MIDDGINSFAVCHLETLENRVGEADALVISAGSVDDGTPFFVAGG